MLLPLDIVEGTIACYYDSFSGTLNGGLNSMFNPCPIFTHLNIKNKSNSLEDQRPCEKYL